MPFNLPTCDDLALDAIAARFGKKRRWLQSRLSEDLRRQPEDQRFQHHHYVGRSPRWTEAEYQALRRAIIYEDTERRRGSASATHAAAPGELFAPAAGPRSTQEAYERVMAHRPGDTPEQFNARIRGEKRQRL
jgi:hypothetical protein